jgi:hypothetical protein
MKPSNQNLQSLRPQFFQPSFGRGAMFVMAVFAAVTGVGQVSSINSVTVNPRVYNDVPGSSLTVVTNYPSNVSFTDQNVSAATGFANRHTWAFSSTSGQSSYQFQNNDFFHATMNLTLTGNPTSPRKEAGFLFSTTFGDIQFIVNTDGHEVVTFGGPSFFAFPSTYNSGDTITLGIDYFLDNNGKRALMFSANGVNSPIQEFTNPEQGIINGTLGGYFQIVNDPNNPSNSGSAVFGNINISPVPEPSIFALGGLGMLGLVIRRRRN